MVPWRKQNRNVQIQSKKLIPLLVRSFCKVKATEIFLLIHIFKSKLLLYCYSTDSILPQKSPCNKYSVWNILYMESILLKRQNIANQSNSFAWNIDVYISVYSHKQSR